MRSLGQIECKGSTYILFLAIYIYFSPERRRSAYEIGRYPDLAGRGIEGDEAHNHLLELCGTQSLNDVTKAQASIIIDRLIKEAKKSEEVTFP